MNALLSAALVLAALPAAAPPAPVQTAAAAIRAAAAAGPGPVGAVVVHVQSGRTIAVNGQERFPLASVFKLPVALAICWRIAEGKLRWQDPLTVTAAQVTPPVARWQGAPITLSVAELVDLMLGQSDNTAADRLLDAAGGATAITALLRAHGLADITITHTERQMEAEPPDADPHNLGTPAAIAALLVRLQQGRLVARADTDRLLAIMAASPTFPQRLRAGAPAGTVVAHKTGTDGRVTNDVGLFTLPAGRGHLAVVVLVKSAPAARDAAEQTIAKIARLAYEAFAR